MKKIEAKNEKRIQSQIPDTPAVTFVSFFPDYWIEVLQPLSIIN